MCRVHGICRVQGFRVQGFGFRVESEIGVSGCRALFQDIRDETFDGILSLRGNLLRQGVGFRA